MKRLFVIFKSSLNSRRGAAFVTVLIMMVVLSILSVTVLEVATTSARTVAYQDKKKQAYYLARSGADTIVHTLTNNPDADASLLGTDPFSGRTSDSNTHFSNGSFTVQVKKDAASGEFLVTGTGRVDDVKSSTTAVIKRMRLGDIFDKALYTDTNLDITGMLINGEVQSAQNISYSNDGHNEYTGTAYPNEPITLVSEWTDVPTNICPDIDLPDSSVNPTAYTKTVSTSGKYENINIENQGTLKLQAGTGVQKIVVGNLTIDNDLTIDAFNTGRVELYVEHTMTIKTSGRINNIYPRNLYIYLAPGAVFTIQANMVLNGYIVGPEATVEFQSDQSVVNGSVFAELLTNNNGHGANGAINYVPVDEVERDVTNIKGYYFSRWQE